MTLPFTIRPAGVADAPTLAVLHVEGWRWGYRELLPSAYLAALSVERHTARWHDQLSSVKDSEHVTFLASDEAGPLGFVSIAPCTLEGGGTGELTALYLAAHAAGTGVAAALHDKAIACFRVLEFDEATLWVFEANVRARRFYERHGWTTQGQSRRQELGGGSLLACRYSLTLEA